jgi:hypothetical protein
LPACDFESTKGDVAVWKRKDIILQSSAEYENPYTDVKLWATFTHADGTSLKLQGFWNGSSEWRVRFSPTKSGKWTYVTECSNPEDSGLQGESGELVAYKNRGSTDLDKHGFIKQSDNNRYFTYADGTPFFWLGDTNWQAPNYVSISKCNYPGCNCNNQFKHEVDNRAEKGFNVYQTYFDTSQTDGGGNSQNGEPKLWEEGQVGKVINTKTFTDKIDYMFEYLSEKGFAIALGMGVHGITIDNMPEEDLLLAVEYLSARYASYNIIWITAQEIDMNVEIFPVWVKTAEVTHKVDAYNHPQGAHGVPFAYTDEAPFDYAKQLDSTDWNTFFPLQSGHTTSLTDLVDSGIAVRRHFYKSYYDKEKITPFVETEHNYEDLGKIPYENARAAAWVAVQHGSAGYTYGAEGIWANCYSTAGNTGWQNAVYNQEPWYMGLNKPGSYEMTYLRRFYEFVNFHNLSPCFDNEAYSDIEATDRLSYSKSDDSGTHVVYLSNTGRTESFCQLKTLNINQKYTAAWYNPRTGKFLDIQKNISSSDGIYQIPDKPNSEDWVYLLSSDKLDWSGVQNEQPYTDLSGEVSGSIVKPKSIDCVQGVSYDETGKMTDLNSYLFDDDFDTVWTTFETNVNINPSTGTQTFIFDMGSPVDISHMLIYPDAKNFTFIPGIRIAASDNLSDWTIITNATDNFGVRGYNKYFEESQMVISEKLSGKYRYVKLILMNNPGGMETTKRISEIQIFAN